MSQEVPDHITALMEYIADDPAIDALTEGRIFGGELSKEVADEFEGRSENGRPAPPKTVLIRQVSNWPHQGRAYNDWGDHRIDVIYYGETPHEVSRLWRLVHPRLKHLRREARNSTLLHRCLPEALAGAQREPDTSWPRIYSSWTVLIAEVPIEEE